MKIRPNKNRKVIYLNCVDYSYINCYDMVFYLKNRSYILGRVPSEYIDKITQHYLITGEIIHWNVFGDKFDINENYINEALIV